MTAIPTAIPKGSLCRPLLLGLLAIVVSACSSMNYTADFANNELFFADVPFRTKAPGDRAVFVTPLKDAREGTVLPMHDQGFPIRYGTDDFWERPVAVMFGEVLERHLTGSELFPAVATQATSEDLILRPTLVMFTVGAKEAMSGSATFAEVGLRIEVLGPVGGDGERPLWHDHTYGNRQVSEYQVQPVSPYRLIGRALQLTVSNTLTGLDGSNVARSEVPVEILVPKGREGEVAKVAGPAGDGGAAAEASAGGTAVGRAGPARR